MRTPGQWAWRAAGLPWDAGVYFGKIHEATLSTPNVTAVPDQRLPGQKAPVPLLGGCSLSLPQGLQGPPLPL